MFSIIDLGCFYLNGIITLQECIELIELKIDLEVKKELEFRGMEEVKLSGIN